MVFERFQPGPDLEHLIREIWVVEDPRDTINRQKIIPDGYCEIVIHYGDPYRINLHGQWETQARVLLSTQLSGHFYLENTGQSGMLGIKLLQTTPYLLFNPDMPSLTDRVVDLATINREAVRLLDPLTDPALAMGARVARAWEVMGALAVPQTDEVRSIQAVADELVRLHGMVDITDLAQRHAMSKRTLERRFKRCIGLSPKFFARIQQFNYIFNSMQDDDQAWVDIALNAGYFDQSHFIRNFRAFTGEQPSRYGFDEQNMANFFLKRS
ncbi:MAG: AraC family transcriptional regulator [Saprospiraceae bacterium]|nr:AraC family transcriptional regulator [Saprospiraceae bacterium]